MNNFYLFHSKQKMNVVQFKQLISQNFEQPFSLFLTDDYHGWIETEDSFFDVLETLLPLINQDLGLGLTILVTHQNHQLSQKVMAYLIQKGSHTCRYIADVLIECLLDGDDRFNRLVQEEFSKVPREIILTAKMFVHCGLNAMKTAEKLYVHRNTLNYRLSKFIEISGLDIRNYRHALYFDIAMRIMNPS